MSDNAHLIVLAGRYLDGQLTFEGLSDWVREREEHWAALSPHSLARALSDTIMLAAYEVESGVRDEESARDVIAEASLESSSAR